MPPNLRKMPLAILINPFNFEFLFSLMSDKMKKGADPITIHTNKNKL